MHRASQAVKPLGKIQRISCNSARGLIGQALRKQTDRKIAVHSIGVSLEFSMAGNRRYGLMERMGVESVAETLKNPSETTVLHS